MRRIPSKHQNGQGFTLIELLTVIAIIAVLAGLLFPVAGAVSTSAKKTQAATDLKSIITSTSSYQADYGKLPLPADDPNAGGDTSTDKVYGTPGGAGDGNTYPGYQLYDILCARVDQVNTFNTQNEYNPKKVVYFEANNVKNPKAPTSGFLTEKFDNGKYTIKAGSLVDPWGTEYIVWLDSNGDGDLNAAVKKYYGAYDKKFGPRASACAASLGPDKTLGSAQTGSQTPDNSDDVISWK